MDALTVVTDVIIILSITVPVLIVAWRKVSTVVADQLREREQTAAAVAVLTEKMEQLEQAYLQEGMRHVHWEAVFAAAENAQSERAAAVTARVDDLQETILKLQAAYVRIEGEQQSLATKQDLDLFRQGTQRAVDAINAEMERRTSVWRGDIEELQKTVAAIPDVLGELYSEDSLTDARTSKLEQFESDARPKLDQLESGAAAQREIITTIIRAGHGTEAKVTELQQRVAELDKG